MELRLICSLQRVPARNDLSYLIASPLCRAFQLLSAPPSLYTSQGIVMVFMLENSRRHT